MTEPSNTAKMVMVQAIANNLDVGDGVAHVIYYSDTRPPSEDIEVNPLAELVKLTLPKPCTKSILPNAIELYASESGMATRGGVAVWARLYNAQGQPVIDLNIGEEIQLENTEVVLGSVLKLDSIFLEPE